ncbi:MAG: hypothetical protein C4323_08685 [Mastigocladus sp. ERB_26_2]
MIANPNICLQGVRPDNQVHLLLWDTPNENDLVRIVLYNNALRVNYRENLLQRINQSDRFLTLHHDLERELTAIKFMCSGIKEQMVLLEGLDCLITYLQVYSPRYLTLFWNNLEKTRKLERILWVILPHQLVPKSWPAMRMKSMLDVD